MRPSSQICVHFKIKHLMFVCYLVFIIQSLGLNNLQIEKTFKIQKRKENNNCLCYLFLILIVMNKYIYTKENKNPHLHHYRDHHHRHLSKEIKQNVT